ncbi:MAG: acyl-CoA synthetase FdrA [Bacillota bacterium]
MFLQSHVYKNTFRDSVYLMRLSSMLRELDGVEGAEVIIGTDHNKKFLRAGDLWTEEIEQNAGANDLIISVRAVNQQKAEAAIQRALDEMTKEVDRGDLAGEFVPRTFETALKHMPGANIALISIPGRYARREAEKILEAGLHVMLFSDNVSMEEEIALKQKALEKGLLLMGPDCGTAIINGVPLAFANRVRRGNIGIVAAAGTGLQEVSSLVHNLGGGISHGIGTGGRDVKDAVGGLMMLQGLKALIEDVQTAVIVIIAKPPEPQVTQKVLQAAAQSPKPVVVNFLGGDPEPIRAAGCESALTLKEAAEKAFRLAGGEPAAAPSANFTAVKEVIEAEKRKLKPGQRYLRGLFSGGTLAYESLLMLNQAAGGIYSNLALEPRFRLTDLFRSREHTIIDFGEDEFTQGRLHPMIDPALRGNRIVAEGKDPETAVIMFDLVLGFNAHPDPAGAAVEAIMEASAEAEREGRHLIFVTSVCGTDEDFQNRREQVEKLNKAGVLVFPSNADASFFVKELLNNLLTEHR